MRYEVEVSGVLHALEIESERSGSINLSIDKRKLAADVAELESGDYSLLIDGRSFEARVSREIDDSDELVVRCAGLEYHIKVKDPRAWRAGRGTALESAGPQRVLAPMPGRVVRLLVAAGENVEAGRGLVVVEAMKMQNEIRAPKSGRIERVLVAEGQAVRSQEALIVIS